MTRDGLGDAHVGERSRISGAERGRVVDRADADDDPLAGHEPGNGLHRAQCAGVGQRDRRARHVVGRQLVRADLADELLVRVDESLEVERVGALDARHDQRVRVVGLLDVDRDAQVDVVVVDDARLTRLVGEKCGVHHRHGIGDRPHDGVADDVGEADLAAARALQVVGQDRTVDLEQPRRHLAKRGGRGHLQAGLHVGDDAGRGASDGFAGCIGSGARCGCGRLSTGAGVEVGDGATGAVATVVSRSRAAPVMTSDLSLP